MYPPQHDFPSMFIVLLCSETLHIRRSVSTIAGIMTRGTALKRLSALLLRGGNATGPVQPHVARTSSAERCQCIATSSTAAAGGTHATPAQPPAAPSAAAKPAQQHSHSGSGSNASGGRSMGPVLLLPAAVAAGLGSWQLARRAEKQQQLDDRLAAMRVRICIPNFTLHAVH